MVTVSNWQISLKTFVIFYWFEFTFSLEKQAICLLTEVLKLYVFFDSIGS